LNDSTEFQAGSAGGRALPIERLKLLAIDDDPTMLQLIVNTLEGVAGQVYHSSEPREGLRLALTYKPHLIVLDCEMPHVHGLELLKELRSMPQTEKMPVLMLTADNSSTTVITALQKGAGGYLLKPFKPLELRERVLKLLGLNP
jgi:DNA-binding response OmpR family regulator